MPVLGLFQACSACVIQQEEFYLEENVSKAITIDEWSADALTTSMVDDVFFILQKCGRRALATGNLQCLCAILGQINNLLSNSLRTALELNWKVLPHFNSIPFSLMGILRPSPETQHILPACTTV
jgi:hypothetical protein